MTRANCTATKYERKYRSMSSPDSAQAANDILFGSAIPSASFKEVGAAYGGPIVKLDYSQQRNYKTGEPEVWADGKPKLQVIVTVKTELRDPSVPDDDGQRRIFLSKKEQQEAVKTAVRNAGARKLEVGGVFSLQYTHQTDNDWGGSPTKHFKAAYVKPQPGADGANQVLGLADTGVQAPNGQPLMAQAQVMQQPAVQQQLPTVQPGVAPASTTATAVAPSPAMNLDAASPEAQALLAKLLQQQQQQQQGGTPQ